MLCYAIYIYAMIEDKIFHLWAPTTQFSPSISPRLILSFMPALAGEERARLHMKVHSCRPSVSRNPEIDLKTKREVGSHPFGLLSSISCSHSHVSTWPHRCMQKEGVAATTCPPDHLKAMQVTPPPSPLPAVPPISVAPATGPSNQNDPEGDWGQWWNALFIHLFTLC